MHWMLKFGFVFIIMMLASSSEARKPSPTVVLSCREGPAAHVRWERDRMVAEATSPSRKPSNLVLIFRPGEVLLIGNNGMTKLVPSLPPHPVKGIWRFIENTSGGTIVVWTLFSTHQVLISQKNYGLGFPFSWTQTYQCVYQEKMEGHI